MKMLPLIIAAACIGNASAATTTWNNVLAPDGSSRNLVLDGHLPARATKPELAGTLCASHDATPQKIG